MKHSTWSEPRPSRPVWRAILELKEGLLAPSSAREGCTLVWAVAGARVIQRRGRRDSVAHQAPPGPHVSLARPAPYVIARIRPHGESKPPGPTTPHRPRYSRLRID